MPWNLIIVAANLALVAAVVLHSRHRVRKRLRAQRRRPMTAREIPAGHPDSGFVLSLDDGRAWTALMATEAAREAP